MAAALRSVPQLPYGHWSLPTGVEKLTGKNVTVQFKDGIAIRGRVLCADGDLGTVTVVWDNGIRSMACTFRTADALSVSVS